MGAGSVLSTGTRFGCRSCETEKSDDDCEFLRGDPAACSFSAADTVLFDRADAALRRPRVSRRHGDALRRGRRTRRHGPWIAPRRLARRGACSNPRRHLGALREDAMATAQQPTHRAYVVVKREGADDFWINVGAAFAHSDGKGFDIMVQAVPIDGKI